MKKKKVVKGILTGLAVVAVIAIATLAYISMNAVHTREKVENIEEIDIISEENLMLTYTIYNTSDHQHRAMVKIFTDGSVYYFNYYCEYTDWFNVRTKEITSAYYLGKISTLELLKLNYHLGEVDRFGEYERYQDPTYIDPYAPDICAAGSGYQAQESSEDETVSRRDEMEMICRSEEKENEYDCYLFLENGSFPTRFSVLCSRNIIRQNYITTKDSHAIAAMEIFRESWFYEQLVELVYEEMYPEIDRNAVNVAEDNDENETSEPVVVEFNQDLYMYAAFRQMITDWAIEGLTGEFLMEYVENYRTNEEYYDNQMRAILEEPRVENQSFFFSGEELEKVGISEIEVHWEDIGSSEWRSLLIHYDDSFVNSYAASGNEEEDIVRVEGEVTFTREEWDEFTTSLVNGVTTYEEIAERLGHPGHIISWAEFGANFTLISWWGTPLYLEFNRDGILVKVY